MNVTSLGYMIREALEDLIRAGKLHNKRVILFGKNAPSEAMFKYLEKNGFGDIHYVDNDRNKDVPSPEDVLVPFDENTMILIASKHFKAMAEQVKQLGYDVDTQVVKVVDFYNIEKFSPNEKIDGHYRKLTLEECREKQLCVIDIIHEICEKHGIRYSLGCGTLLGAIRHKGFIPWDDDVDLIMPYPDYRRFMDIISSNDELRPVWRRDYHENYPFFLGRVEYIRSLQMSWEYPFLFRGGMTVDIFPIWGMPNTKEEQLAYFQEVCAHKNQMTQFSILEAETGNFDELDKLAEELESRYPFDESCYAGYIAGSSGMEGIMDSDIFKETRLIPFENRQYHGLKEYDRYLQAIYGDYMTPPKVDKRDSNHSINVYELKA